MDEGMNGQEQQQSIRDRAAALQEELGPRIEQAREALVRINTRALRVMREYPGAVLICAVGVGFLLGRLASRR